MAGIDNLKPFKPGYDPRRGTKPKGAIHISTHIQNMLNDEEFSIWLADPREGFVEYKGAPMKAIIKTALIKAAAGDKDAREWLAKYGYGQKLEVEHSGEINTTKELTDEQLRERINEQLRRQKLSD